MKRLIKSLLSDDILITYRLLKAKYFPSGRQKEVQKRDSEEVIKWKSFYSALINAGELCFDVGANIGNRVEVFLQLGAKVIAVEPQKYCHKVLKRRFGNKIVVVTKGLGDKEETRDFYVSNDSIISSFSTDWIDAVKIRRFKNPEWRKPVKTEMTTLDRLIERYGKPSFIKIDVEGFELEVLRGLSEPIKLISFEYVPERPSATLDCISQVEKSNKNIECNYSTGESMEFSLRSWISSDDMKELIKTNKFIGAGWGDMYVRTKII